MKKLTTTALVTLAGLAATAAEVEAQAACETYRVKRGDTLREIAQAAYGNDEIREIYKHNKQAIGRNPNIIVIGTVLQLPCADGSLPGDETAKTAPITEPVETAADEGQDVPKVISFVTANGYLPYTDESLPGQGIFTALVERAMLRANPEQPYTVTFVNDWAAHLEALLPSMAFDASFPWTRPGCEVQKDLSAIEFYSCQNYVYSSPFYEIVDGFFSRTGSIYDGATHYEALEGATICRPEGYSTSHLVEANLLPPVVTLSQPDTAVDCFDLLMDGAVDVVALDTRSGAHLVAAMGLEQQVSENDILSSIVPLQVAVHAENPNADELIADLNSGLILMQESGEWRDMISDALQGEIQKQAGGVMN